MVLLQGLRTHQRDRVQKQTHVYDTAMEWRRTAFPINSPGPSKYYTKNIKLNPCLTHKEKQLQVDCSSQYKRQKIIHFNDLRLG